MITNFLENRSENKYGFERHGKKTGVGNASFWSEIGWGFGESGVTPPLGRGGSGKKRRTKIRLRSQPRVEWESAKIPIFLTSCPLPHAISIDTCIRLKHSSNNKRANRGLRTVRPVSRLSWFSTVEFPLQYQILDLFDWVFVCDIGRESRKEEWVNRLRKRWVYALRIKTDFIFDLSISKRKRFPSLLWQILFLENRLYIIPIPVDQTWLRTVSDLLVGKVLLEVQNSAKSKCTWPGKNEEETASFAVQSHWYFS